MTVAAAAAQYGPPMAERAGMGEPCSHCDDCDGTPCPMSTLGCVQACAGVAPSLMVAAFVLPVVVADHLPWSLHAVALNGLSQPPDPFPPRA